MNILILALVGLLALGGSYFAGRLDGARGQFKDDSDEIAGLKAKVATTRAANESLQLAVAGVRADAAKCSAGVDLIADAQRKAAPAIAAILQGYDTRSRTLASDIATRAAASAAAASHSEQQQCASVRSTLDDLADKVRGIDPAAHTMPLAPIAPITAQPRPLSPTAVAPAVPHKPLPSVVKVPQ